MQPGGEQTFRVFFVFFKWEYHIQTNHIGDIIGIYWYSALGNFTVKKIVILWDLMIRNEGSNMVEKPEMGAWDAPTGTTGDDNQGISIRMWLPLVIIHL